MVENTVLCGIQLISVLITGYKSANTLISDYGVNKLSLRRIALYLLWIMYKGNDIQAAIICHYNVSVYLVRVEFRVEWV